MKAWGKHKYVSLESIVLEGMATDFVSLYRSYGVVEH